MDSDIIQSIGIETNGSLWVKPLSAIFPYIYREAMEVNWDPNSGRLFGTAPRDWDQTRWFRQIIDAAHNQGCELVITDKTIWFNISDKCKQAILEFTRWLSLIPLADFPRYLDR